MIKATTAKMLILAEMARVAELLNEIPDDKLKYQCYGGYAKEISELKVKMAELRRDTMALEKAVYDWAYRND